MLRKAQQSQHRKLWALWKGFYNLQAGMVSPEIQVRCDAVSCFNAAWAMGPMQDSGFGPQKSNAIDAGTGSYSGTVWINLDEG
jgi:hypothetical protein